MQQIHILSITIAQAEALRELAILTFTDTYGAQNTPENLAAYIGMSFNLPQLVLELQQPGVAYLGAFDAEEVLVGYIKLVDDAWHDLPNSIEVARLYVHPACKGLGIGAQLITSAKDWATQHNKRAMWLGVWQENPDAIAFYERMGFVIHGTHIFQFGDDPQTDWIMAMGGFM